jgi:predicted O-methyltransferase YrrM
MKPPEYRPDRGLLNRGIFGLLGLRPAAAEHSRGEGEMLCEYAEGRKTIVETGVAEGGSAWEMRTVMAPDGTLFLIDPYDLSRLGPLSPKHMIARRLVASVTRADARWIREVSQPLALQWTTPIDFLFIDGDHSYEGVRADWQGWTPHLAPGGHVALHDARIEADWTDANSGPTRLLAELRDDPAWQIVGEIDSLAVLRPARA